MQPAEDICLERPMLPHNSDWHGSVQVEDVTDDGKVQTKLLHKGKDYKRPNEGAKVKIAYTGRIGGPEGPVFEEHTAESPLEFVTDEGVRCD